MSAFLLILVIKLVSKLYFSCSNVKLLMSVVFQTILSTEGQIGASFAGESL